MGIEIGQKVRILDNRYFESNTYLEIVEIDKENKKACVKYSFHHNHGGLIGMSTWIGFDKIKG